MATAQKQARFDQKNNFVTLRELTPQEVAARLARYERQYGMTSETFYALWKTGHGPDMEDSTAWALLYQISRQNGDAAQGR
jgi:hypothetical protein